MNTPISPSKLGGTFIVPPSFPERTLEHLRMHRTEAVCFWLGRVLTDRSAIEEIWIPQFRATSTFYDIDPPDMLKLKAHLDESGRSLLVQIHSHPGAAFHSSTDDLNAASPWPGFISIVVPNFGHIPRVFWDGVEVYELLGGGKWRHINSAEVRVRFCAEEE